MPCSMHVHTIKPVQQQHQRGEIIEASLSTCHKAHEAKDTHTDQCTAESMLEKQ